MDLNIVIDKYNKYKLLQIKKIHKKKIESSGSVALSFLIVYINAKETW